MADDDDSPTSLKVQDEYALELLLEIICSQRDIKKKATGLRRSFWWVKRFSAISWVGLKFRVAR